MGAFSNRIQKFASDSEAKSNRVLRRVSLDLLRRLIIRSPVDTGRFRGNWVTGINQFSEVNPDTKDKSGGVTISKGESDLARAKIGDRIFISNNLPYAVRLENGWSLQAPAGMLAITAAEWPGIVSDAVDAEK